MKIADLYKIILEQGFTPEIRKQVEEGTYSSKDIADLMETMAAGNSALEKRVGRLEEVIGNTPNSSTTYLHYKKKHLPDKKSTFLYGAGKIAAGLACGGLLTALGVYTNKSIITAEIGAVVSSFITVSSYFVRGGKVSNLPKYMPEYKNYLKCFGIFGGITGAICGAATYFLLPHAWQGLYEDFFVNILIKGAIGGLCGATIPTMFSCILAEEYKEWP